MIASILRILRARVRFDAEWGPPSDWYFGRSFAFYLGVYAGVGKLGLWLWLEPQ